MKYIFIVNSVAGKGKYKKILPNSLLCIAIVVFLIAASPGWLDIYYKCLLIKQVYFVSKYGKILFLIYMNISVFI